MNKPARTLQWVLWGFLALIVVATVGVLFLSKNIRRQKSVPPLPVLSVVPDFVLTNQESRAVNAADLRSTVWIADIIFTQCGGPCPEMTRKMSELQAVLPAGCKLLTLTTDPEHDSPAVLKKYGERFGADFGRWTFLTGQKQQIYKLGVEGLKLSSVEIDPKDRQAVNDLFIHATYFVLMDKQGRMRAVFETAGEGLDWNKTKEEIISAARKLAQEKVQ